MKGELFTWFIYIVSHFFGGSEWASMFWTKSVNELSSVALAVLYSWEGEFPDPMGILRAWHSCTKIEMYSFDVWTPPAKVKGIPQIFKKQWSLKGLQISPSPCLTDWDSCQEESKGFTFRLLAVKACCYAWGWGVDNTCESLSASITRQLPTVSHVSAY